MKRMQKGAALIEVNDADAEFYLSVGFNVIEPGPLPEKGGPEPESVPEAKPVVARKPRAKK